MKTLVHCDDIRMDFYRLHFVPSRIIYTNIKLIGDPQVLLGNKCNHELSTNIILNEKIKYVRYKLLFIS